MDGMKMSSTEMPGSLDLGFPMAAQWNYMNISSHVPLDGLQMNANLVCFARAQMGIRNIFHRSSLSPL